MTAVIQDECTGQKVFKNFKVFSQVTIILTNLTYNHYSKKPKD